jgi:hypothetical protein
LNLETNCEVGMTTNKRFAWASAAMLVGLVQGASAYDLSIGGIDLSAGGSDGGVSASVGTGDSSVGASVGGSGDTIASVSGGAGSGIDQAAGLNITTQDGQPIVLDRNANSTNAGVNLGFGGLLGGLPVIGGPGTGGPLPGGGGGGGGISDAGVATVFASLDGNQQQLLLNRCATVLARPFEYESDLVSLCQILARFRR